MTTSRDHTGTVPVHLLDELREEKMAWQRKLSGHPRKGYRAYFIEWQRMSSVLG